MDVLNPSGSFGVPALGRQAPCAGKDKVKLWWGQWGEAVGDSDAHPQGSEQGTALQSMSCVSPAAPEADCRIQWSEGRVWRSQDRGFRGLGKKAWGELNQASEFCRGEAWARVCREPAVLVPAR